MKRLLTIAMLVTLTSALSASERDIVKPLIGDKLISVTFTHREMTGGEIDRRIMDLIYKNYMVLNLDRDWLDKFRNRTDRGNIRNVYYGIGKVFDAGSLFAQYTGDPAVAERTQYIMDQLRASRDPDGYLGFWNVEPKNHQNVVNWILHEQEYINLALVRNYRTTGNPQSLADAKVMADYIMRMFPANENGEHIIPGGTSIAGITEGFVELYRVTGGKKYLDFARNLQYEPHWYYLKPFDAWERNISKANYHVYVMLSHMYPDTGLYRLLGGDDYLKKSLWMKQELLERGRGGLLVTGSTSEGEHFTYNQKGSGAIEESCVTAYLLRWIDSLMRLEGDMRYGDIMERTIYNALFGAQSPDGRHICYFTPFTGKRSFQERDTFCCNGNFRRAVAELPEKVYYRTQDAGIALNLFTSSDKKFDVNGKIVEIKQETTYPNSGEVKLSFICSEPVEFTFRFRTPRWAETMECVVCNVPCALNKSQLGYAEIKRLWKSGDILTVSMPMNWRFVRGRMIQDGRVALMRGPVLFTFSDKLNAEVLKKCPKPRDLVLDPTSIGNPSLDDSVRPNGQKVVVKAWTNPERTGDPVDVVLTEFVDPNGIDVYFKIPNLNDTKSIRIVDDELLSEPRQSANGEITFAWYGPKSDGNWKDMFTVDGELVADLAADYQNPQGKQDVPAVFPDKSKSGSWSLFNCKNDGLLSTARDSDKKQLNSKFKVDGCPVGYAYGLEGGANLGFFADYMPTQNMEENWGRHYSREMFDRVIPADQRKQFLLTHPIANVDSYNVIRWTPGSQLSSKRIGVAGTMLTNRGGNGVSLKLVNWKDDKTPVVLNVLYPERGRKGIRAHKSEFVVYINPGDLGKHVDIVIGNNGNFTCDATAVKLGVYATDKRYETPGVDVTEKVQSVFRGKFRTDLGKYADLFGDPAPGQEKTLKLRVQDLCDNTKYMELPENASIELP
ncbi:MAG: glycoside hydrolase family 127 protein [Kiritimatiellae bacterium]|nr:glycoside hydrolase family 127 protein [Kiritimatiellia bacterium]MDD5520051.1 glycoside hydrolase family 127 protein [Kiritimatiellia bacterium]